MHHKQLEKCSDYVILYDKALFGTVTKCMRGFQLRVVAMYHVHMHMPEYFDEI